MAEENGSAGAEGAAQGATAQGLRKQVLAQFVRDNSFENIFAQKGLTVSDLQPDIQVGVNLDARQRPQANTYDVIAKFKITSTNKANNETLFVLELEYGGVFFVEGVPPDQLHPFLLIECPRLLFPFVRRIISDVTQDGGFPALNIDNVDFLALYRSEMARRAQLAAATPAASA